MVSVSAAITPVAVACLEKEPALKVSDTASHLHAELGLALVTCIVAVSFPLQVAHDCDGVKRCAYSSGKLGGRELR